QWAVPNDIVNNRLVVFQSTASGTYSGVISGTGGVNFNGNATLLGNNTYTGTTGVSSFALNIGNGGTSGAIAGDLTVTGFVVFNRSDDVVYAGKIVGGGSIEQLGTGKLTLTGNSTGGPGGISVAHGALELDGPVYAGGPLSVSPGTVLTGT